MRKSPDLPSRLLAAQRNEADHRQDDEARPYCAESSARVDAIPGLARRMAMSQQKAISATVTGDDQKVGFRAMVMKQAIEYNLAGVAKNEPKSNWARKNFLKNNPMHSTFFGIIYPVNGNIIPVWDWRRPRNHAIFI
jgi:Acylphosphatase